MRLRSLLFVPGDRPDRFDKAVASGADAIILDLEDSVAPSRKAFAREAVADYLQSADRQTLRLVRINPVASPWLEADLNVATLSQGLVLPKAEGAETFMALDAASGDRRLPPVLPIATETPAAIFRLQEYAALADRLLGLTWGAEDLPSAIGAVSSRQSDGAFTPPYELARSLTLFAAHAARTQAIETVFTDIGDTAGLTRYARRGAFDGFSGMMAIHPSQVGVIHAAFSPSAAALDEARAIVEAFAGNPDLGAVQLGGRMVDAPHLKRATRLLEAWASEPPSDERV